MSRLDGIRNEDLCDLTFEDQTFDAVVSLDVFEHVPAYRQAFKECARVLKPRGRMMWSVPFLPSSRTNSVRARIVDGQVQHIVTPPEYHGDPLSSNGILCFQHFGWEMLDEIMQAGFKDAYAVCYQSIPFGYLGGEQFMFFAVK
jgi:SAM-dependent methyltransferase